MLQKQTLAVYFYLTRVSTLVQEKKLTDFFLYLSSDGFDLL